MPSESKNIIFCFDGTGNDPNEKTERADDDPDAGSLSNVAKLHLLFGGDFTKDAENTFYDMPSQVSLYYSGVGTLEHQYFGVLRRTLNKLFGHRDPDAILDEAMEDLDKVHDRGRGDKIFVVGFSRGAAIARRFCSSLSDRDMEVEMLIAFDTVASIGMPDLSTENRPASDVVFEHGHRVADKVQQALHCVSIDEKRRAFQPTLMNAEEKVTEIWFAGNHGDIGGGWNHDGLSDTVLQFVLDEFDNRNVGLEVLAANQVKLGKINEDTEDNPEYAFTNVKIEQDDIKIVPNHDDYSHEQPIHRWNDWWWADHRRVCVISNDEIVPGAWPIAHHSVVNRIQGRPIPEPEAYRPQSLVNQKHKILYDNGTYQDFNGLDDHLLSLKQGESATEAVHAKLPFTHTGILLHKGTQYRFEPDSSQTWTDGSIVCSAGGWESWYTLPARSFKRFKGANWFSMIGAVVGSDEKNETTEELFEIGNGPAEYTPEITGEFVPFANDLSPLYGNNKGSIDVKVTCLPTSMHLREPLPAGGCRLARL